MDTFEFKRLVGLTMAGDVAAGERLWSVVRGREPAPADPVGVSSYTFNYLGGSPGYEHVEVRTNLATRPWSVTRDTTHPSSPRVYVTFRGLI